jgi:hypothetical protein
VPPKSATTTTTTTTTKFSMGDLIKSVSEELKKEETERRNRK